MGKVKLAIVGCGDIAQFTALFGKLSRRIQMTVACDVDMERAKQFAKRFAIPQTEHVFADVLASDVDAVYLAVPHHMHCEMIKAAIEAKKAVFVEKPVTRTYAEAVEITRLAETAGVKVAVNYQYRYDSGCYALAHAVHSGMLGKIIAVRINVPWLRQQDYFEKSAWHQKISTAGGGTLITQGSHFLDIALWALGTQPISAVGYTKQNKFKNVEVEDVAQGIVEMSDGALIQISSTMASASEQPVTIEVYGDKATAVYSNKPWPNVKFIGVNIHRKSPPIWGVHALQRSLEAFGLWVQTGEPHKCSAKESLVVLSVVEAIYHSAKTGQKTLVVNQLEQK
jgi:predicted dehydrogenase